MAVVPAKAAFVQSLTPLEQFISQDPSFASAVPRLLAAIACHDGPVTAAELAVLSALVAEAGNSMLFATLLMDALERRLPMAQAVTTIRLAATTADGPTREAAWAMLVPMLELQHGQARTLARDCCDALGLVPTPSRLAKLPPESEGGLVDTFIDWLPFTRRNEGKPAETLAQACGSPDLQEALQRFRRKQIDLDDVHQKALLAAGQTRALMQELARPAEVAQAMQSSAQALDATTRELRSQVEQRLSVLEARLVLERRTLIEDIDEAVHDAGNTIELSIRERLDTDKKWKDPTVWRGIARHVFGPEMERRLDRLVRRREDHLQLLLSELRLFQSEIRLTQAQLEGAEHRGALSALMPRTGAGTQALLLTDRVANLALVSGPMFLGALKLTLLGAAVAPLAPFATGTVIAAALFKWFTDQAQWKAREVETKRQAFEQELRSRLQQVQADFEHQLAGIEAGFVRAARCMVLPVLLEAQAAQRLPGMHQRLADDVTSRCEQALLQFSSPVKCAAEAGCDR